MRGLVERTNCPIDFPSCPLGRKAHHVVFAPETECDIRRPFCLVELRVFEGNRERFKGGMRDLGSKSYERRAVDPTGKEDPKRNI